MIEIPEYKDAEAVFRFFEEISRIPHGSENTAPIADYLVSFAEARGLWCYRDAADNVVIRKPATAGKESSPTVIFQGHTDMVADKVAGCDIDLLKDGLKIFRDGDLIRAEGTTLGGDDGVAIAYALAVLDSDDIVHPEFEALFTSNEEIGLLGATALDCSVLKGRLMVNIDSDIEGIFTVGCAGGMRIDTRLEAERAPADGECLKLSVSGLRGGHSGIEIDKGRSNAIKLLAEILSEAKDLRVIEIEGGNADNAIPRSAECVFKTDDGSVSAISVAIARVFKEHGTREPDIKITLDASDTMANAFTSDASKRFIKLINDLRSGVVTMSEEIPGLVETSANIGIITAEEGAMCCSLSIRSSKNASKESLRASIREAAEGLGADVSERGAYPAWEYRKDSVLRDIMVKTYEDMYKRLPEVITIHAGLECGIFSDKMPGLDCVSIGPDNFDIHTPEEHLSISSTARVWEYLKELLKRI